MDGFGLGHVVRQRIDPNDVQKKKEVRPQTLTDAWIWNSRQSGREPSKNPIDQTSLWEPHSRIDHLEEFH